MGEANLKAAPQITKLMQHITRASNKSEASIQVRERFQAIMQSLIRQTDMGSEKAFFNTEDVNRLKKLDGNVLLQQLRKTLLRGGRPLEKQFIDSEHLSHLADLLTAAGVSAQNANQFINSLKARVGNRALSLATIFNELANLESLQSVKNPDILMELSALPYMETILQGLGLSPEQISQAFDGAVDNTGGIGLNRLIANLKQIDARSVDLSDPAKQAMSSQKLAELLMRADLLTRSEGIDAQSPSHVEFGKAMNSLLFSEETTGSAGRQDILTLPRLIAKLETMMVTRAPLGVSEETIAERINLFLEKITIPTSSDSQSSQLSTNLKNQILRLPHADRNNAANFSRQNQTPDLSANRQVKLAARSAKATDGFSMQQLAVGVSNDESSFGSKLEAKQVEALQDRLALLGGQGDKKVAWEPTITAPASKSGSATLPAYVLNQVGRQLIRSHLAGENEIRLQLKPPQLGRLQMYIERVEGVLKVEIASELQATRDLLLAHSQELKALLSDQGLRVDRIDVNLNDQFEHAMTFNRQESNQSRGRKNKSAVPKNMSAAPSANTEAQPPKFVSDGMVDLVA